jgi:hypothetical protein
MRPQIKRILPNITLAKIERDGRVRFTLVGTRCVAHAGIDYTNHYLEDLDLSRDLGTNWHEVYRAVCRERRPVFGIVKAFLKDNHLCEILEVLLPLSDDGETVTHCIAVEDARLGRYDVTDLVPTRLALKQIA